TVAGGAANQSGQTQVDLRHAGAGQVVEGDGVGAAERIDCDVLDATEVHRSAVEVAGDPGPGAVGRDVEPLGGVRAVEHQGVANAAGVAALDGVAAVARVPDERVDPRAADQEVVPGAADLGQPDQLGRVGREQARGE